MANVETDVFRSSGHAASSQAQGNSVVGRECLLLEHVLFRDLESIHAPVFFWPFFSGRSLEPPEPIIARQSVTHNHRLGRSHALQTVRGAENGDRQFSLC